MAALRQDVKLFACADGAIPYIACCIFHQTPGQLQLFTVICARCRRTAGGFFANWAANMLVQLVAQAFGLLIGATVMDPKAAQVGQGTKR